VIGVIQPYAGRWGISTNPESFAVHGYRKYFSDKNNNVILRLSKDGITEISNYGMQDFFRDQLGNIDTSSSEGFVRGGYDVYNSQYVVSTSVAPVSPEPTVGTAIGVSNLGNELKVSSPAGKILAGSYVTSTSSINKTSIFVVNVSSDKLTITLSEEPASTIPGETFMFSPIASTTQTFRTLSFDDHINGWTSLYSYQPDQLLSVRNKFYSIASGLNENNTPSGKYGIWQHHSKDVNRGSYYERDNVSSVTLVFNPDPTRSKTFKTISYEGSNGWNLSALGYDGSNWSLTGMSSGNTGKDVVGSVWRNIVDVVNSIRSYTSGEYVLNPIDGLAVIKADYYSVFGTEQPPYPRLHAGFNRKENTYVANLVNNSPAAEGEIIFGSVMSGIKGFYTTATFRTDATTDFGGEKQLFLASSNFVANNGY
jgi:hypothetical protein